MTSFSDSVVFLQKKSLDYILYRSSDDCDPRCINGVCSDGNCFCKLMWQGLDCSQSKVLF